jgi:hypothetical protein
VYCILHTLVLRINMAVVTGCFIIDYFSIQIRNTLLWTFIWKNRKFYKLRDVTIYDFLMNPFIVQSVHYRL